MSTSDEALAAAVADGAYSGLASVPAAKRTGGKRSRQKGDRTERAIVNAFIDAGVSAERVPLSGSAGGSYIGDLTFAALGEDWLGESKCRADGFKRLRDWLTPVRALFLKADREETMVVLRFSDFVALVKGKRG